MAEHDGGPVDPVALTQALVARPSVTPDAGAALGLLAEALTPFGFRAERADRGGVANLMLIWDSGAPGPSFGFNGHTDVVPVGDPAAWSVDPFGGELRDGLIWGRGAVDMKSGVAAFAAAAAAFVASAPPQAGALTLLITGDEEGDAVDGTRALLDALDASGRRLDACLVGEPTSAAVLGDVMKVGRRGSLTADFRATGRQGHTAYPERAANPLPPLTRLLDRLASAEIDQGTAHFAPSTLALTTIDVGNPANNVVPGAATARANLRFNDAQTSEALIRWIREQAARAAAEAPGVEIDVSVKVSGEAFVTQPGPLTELIAASVEAETGRRPAAETGGGTSDARFIKDHCPVVEFGLVGATMHAVDERAPADDIRALARIYQGVLTRFFA